ncbi:hypothetical protein C4D60_Mb01t15330 [Musa balbisiana]|uniref:Uncharacterized protein n=1 Tax=Musa balbisiana TaxID=52838 RepID=A0A4S8JMF0_MUSBA|nr:hypothetical protein C4D60_Mb01t15330 [Musa balbisiana]
MDSVARQMVPVLFLFLLLLSATAPSESFAGHRKLMHHASVPHEATEKSSSKDNVVVHHRFLTVKTNDYGAYDPSPALNKPPYKLINN